MDKSKLCAFGIANLLICTGILAWLYFATESLTASIIILLGCLAGTCGLVFATYKAGDKWLAAVSGLLISAASGMTWYCQPVPAMGVLSIISALLALAVLCSVISSTQARST